MTPIALKLVHPLIPPCFSKKNDSVPETNSGLKTTMKTIFVMSSVVLDSCGSITLFIIGILGVASVLSLSPAAAYGIMAGGLVWTGLFYTWMYKTQLGTEPFCK